MDQLTLEGLIDGGQETDVLEFKQAMRWNPTVFVKDILAMANVIDGGRIIVGVEDGSFTKQGLSDEEVDTYNIDQMRDQIAPFADPRVVFSSQIVEGRDGRKYIVIEVMPFDDLPVICARDSGDVHAGTIYFRGRSRRPESARVSRSSDMRDIVERAAALSASRLRRIGFVPSISESPDYDAELGGL